MPLGNAFGNPDNVPAFLLLQLDVSVENTEMELVEECQFVQFHLQEEEVEREERDISEANQHISYDHSKRGVPFAIYFSKWCF